MKILIHIYSITLSFLLQVFFYILASVIWLRLNRFFDIIIFVEKNEIYEGIAGAVAGGGEGIIKVDGVAVFVPFCLTGERVRFQVLKADKKAAYGKIIEILSPSEERVIPRCPVFGKCGGCDLQHMSYSAQLSFKRKTVENTLKKIGGIDFPVGNTVPSGEEYGYRNKCALPVGVINGETVCGFYAPRSHRIVPVDGCDIQAEWIKNVISSLKKFFSTGVKGYDEATKKGDIRHAVVREIGGKFIFALVVTHVLDTSFLVEELKKNFKEFTLLLNINTADGNAIFGREWRTVYGGGFFGAEEQGIKYKAGANTFIQVNDGMRSKLYSAVLKEAEEGTAAIDLYSGGGLLTAMLAKKCGSAYGIEIVEEASRCADELKRENNLDGKMFNICGKVEDEINAVFQKTAGKRIIVCDPPRKGMEKSVVYAVKNSDADKIVLISCNPATLARDLGLLTGSLIEKDGALVKCESPVSDYEIESITPFDMFPQTKHVETLAVLKRK